VDDVVSEGGGSFMQAIADDAASINTTGRLVRMESAPEEIRTSLRERR
jgi:hypothetical protein